MSFKRTDKEINDLLLANFYAQSAAAGKPLHHAPQWDHFAAIRQEEAAKKTKSIDEQFAILRACFGIKETVKQTVPVDPLVNKAKQTQ
jgi:hypothetical protein